MRAKKGGPAAITATAHKIARIFYSMLKNKTPYQEHSQENYEQRRRERAIADLKRKAKRLGYQVEEVAAGQA